MNSLDDDDDKMDTRATPSTACAATFGRTMSAEAMQALFEMREKNQLCDAILVLDDGTRFPVHRAILCASSVYFK